MSFSSHVLAVFPAMVIGVLSGEGMNGGGGRACMSIEHANQAQQRNYQKLSICCNPSGILATIFTLLNLKVARLRDVLTSHLK
jgi:hypothetical protein